MKNAAGGDILTNKTMGSGHLFWERVLTFLVNVLCF